MVLWFNRKSCKINLKLYSEKLPLPFNIHVNISNHVNFSVLDGIRLSSSVQLEWFIGKIITREEGLLILNEKNEFFCHFFFNV
jgi:hypothetical protein